MLSISWEKRQDLYEYAVVGSGYGGVHHGLFVTDGAGAVRYKWTPAGPLEEIGLAYLKFRTFEDIAAVGNLAGFLGSFQITSTSDPMLQLRARMRFLSFTAQFAQREYDPLSPPTTIP